MSIDFSKYKMLHHFHLNHLNRIHYNLKMTNTLIPHKMYNHEQVISLVKHANI